MHIDGGQPPAPASPLPIPVALGLFLPLLFVGAYYLSYAQSAWFLQDDFQLIMQYAQVLQPHQLWNFENFGRFLSRNVYWHLGVQWFALHAPLFYLLNLSFICATSLLLYRLVRSQQGWFAGLVAVLCYLCLPGTVEAYAWLANSQHLLGHFFVLLFVYLFSTRPAPPAAGWAAARAPLLLIAVLLLGLLSNAFMGMVLSLPVWMLLADRRHRGNRWNYVVPLLGTALFLYFYVRLSPLQTGAYTTSFTLETFWRNACHYYGGTVGAALWVGTVLGGAALAWSKGRLFCSWLFIASVAFFLPFAFLEHQRYGTYATLTHLFLSLACWTLFCSLLGTRKPQLRLYAGVCLVALLLVQSLLPLRYFAEHPSGKIARAHVDALRLFDAQHPELQYHCFRDDPRDASLGGDPASHIPAAWWQLGFGTAFSLFVNPLKHYALSSPTARCDVTWIFRGSRLERADP